ncbi:MAG: RluA family pseudouridine synthase [Oscillospiraceae bacterium]|nr:RluA family pseudouridine synthase [Oscillospiraceae bacterium]
MKPHNNKIILLTDSDCAGQRLDAFVSRQTSLSRSSVQRLIDGGDVTIDGAPVPKNYRLRPNMTVGVTVPNQPQIYPEEIDLDIIYEDSDLLVVNKPKGMVVHPAAGNNSGTLVNALIYHYGDGLSKIGGDDRPGIVHRIDKDTSGLLLAAKNDSTHIGLAEQLAAHTIDRQYQAIVHGGFKETQGSVNAAIGRSRSDRKRMSVDGINAKQAQTLYTVLADYGDFTHLALQLTTGRTHQIRVHMAHVGRPVAGDAVYGPKRCITGLGGQCLHAKSIGFTHPGSGERMNFDCCLPEYFTGFLEKIKNKNR